MCCLSPAMVLRIYLHVETDTELEDGKRIRNALGWLQSSDKITSMSECAESLGVSGTGYKDEKLLDELKDGYWELEQYSGAAGRERTGRIQKILRRCSTELFLYAHHSVQFLDTLQSAQTDNTSSNASYNDHQSISRSQIPVTRTHLAAVPIIGRSSGFGGSALPFRTVHVGPVSVDGRPGWLKDATGQTDAFGPQALEIAVLELEWWDTMKPEAGKRISRLGNTGSSHRPADPRCEPRMDKTITCREPGPDPQGHLTAYRTDPLALTCTFWIEKPPSSYPLVRRLFALKPKKSCTYQPLPSSYSMTLNTFCGTDFALSDYNYISERKVKI
ncbi:hypothetical protein E5288_WYG016692 [Bos mutus]|uniref:Uncharacterized protein n=1 Tax=Bos mutus TaxID=72004 RepID=A0A6B0R4J2_9CETA|nr:hypothetical protein [Bos mutus]